jgi:endonuclease YncB( thermonuclease family)
MEIFRNYTATNTPNFSLAGLSTHARVVSIYDGDSMTCIIPVFGQFCKFSIRLYGIDTCEIRSKRPENKELAIKARNRLIDLVTQDAAPSSLETKKEIDAFLDANVYLVHLHCRQSDKYGRILAEVHKDSSEKFSFSDILIQERLAYEYKGDTKLTEEEQVKLLTSVQI